MNAQNMIEKRARLWEQMKDFLDTHRGDDGCLSAEDDATYAKMESDLANMSKEIDRASRMSAIEAAMSAPTANPLVSTPDAGARDQKTGRASNAYREDFFAVMRGKPAVHNVLSEGTDADGGYLVPTEFEREVITGLSDAGSIREIANVITTASERKIAIAATSAVAHWTDENAAYTETSPTFTQKALDAYKMTCLIRVSEELLQDSFFNLEGYLRDEIVRAFAVLEDEAFCVGTGSGQPTGIFTANGGDVGVTTASADKVTFEEITDLIYSLKAPYRRNGRFMTNDSTIAAIRKIKDGNGQYIWQPSLQAGQPDRLLGYELRTTPSAPTMAAGALAIAFGDFGYFWIADRGARTFRRLNELYATNGQVGFIAAQRLDAKVMLPEAIKLLKMHA